MLNADKDKDHSRVNNHIRPVGPHGPIVGLARLCLQYPVPSPDAKGWIGNSPKAFLGNGCGTCLPYVDHSFLHQDTGLPLWGRFEQPRQQQLL